MPLAGCIAVPSPWAPSTSRNGFIGSGSSAMCDWPSVPLYTRHIFGMRVVLSAGRAHRVRQRCGQEAGLERGELHGVDHTSGGCECSRRLRQYPRMARLSVGVLGLSHDHVWGNLAALAAGEHGRLVAAAEPDGRLRERLRDLDGGVSTHDTFDALLERRDLDAVMIFS